MIYRPVKIGEFKVLKRGATFDTVVGRAGCCYDDMTEFKFGAQFAPITGSSAVQEIDLLDYAKEKLTIAPFNFVKAVHYTGSLSQPPAITAGLAAGTGATVSMEGAASDTAMTLTVTAGASPASGSAICTVHFGTAFSSQPHVMVCPASDSAAGLPVYIASPGLNQFSLNIATSHALSAASTYQWNIIVVQLF